jgi:hypothetical protein
MPALKPLAAPVLLTFLAGCAVAASSKPAGATGPGAGASRVEKVREPLEVTPLELHFSGLRGATKGTESVAVKNTGNEPAQVKDLRVVGTDAATFKILDLPSLPVSLQSGASFSFSVGFEPAADAEPGVHHARVRIVRTEEDDGPPCDLTALVTRSAGAADEPTLSQILEALGYDVDVGSKALKLPATPSPLGDEIKAPLFQRAKPGVVGFYIIARYTSNEASSFGYYLVKNGKPVVKPVGAAAKGHHQTLNPELEGESQTSFEAGEGAFGVYLKVGKRTLYSDDKLNPGPRRHVARAFPLRSQGRTPVQDAYVVAFDEDGDGDFQDHVFMLWNAIPAKAKRTQE